MIKDQKEILEKLNIAELNPMQLEAHSAINSTQNVIILSPTGSGKTLAFLLPLIDNLDLDNKNVQVLIVVPSRELAIQIEQVIREMGAGFKTICVYGGRDFSKDKMELKSPPTILVGTPGRVADHLRRGTFSTKYISALVLDEFDKSLEIGFEPDMKDILSSLTKLDKKILTSATQKSKVPDFVEFKNFERINFLKESESQLEIKVIQHSETNKLETLIKSLYHIGDKPGIIFCNFKDDINKISDFLKENKIRHGCFYGGMEQKDRERVLIKFRNGTLQLIVATDLAARGIDIPEIKFIIHYQTPNRKDEFTHRNGRTARMGRDGTAYVLAEKNGQMADYIKNFSREVIIDSKSITAPLWKTVFVSGGRKDKISKGDIAGFFLKQGKLNSEDLGVIELKQDCAFVAIKEHRLGKVILRTDNTRLKKKKVRVYSI